MLSLKNGDLVVTPKGPIIVESNGFDLDVLLEENVIPFKEHPSNCIRLVEMSEKFFYFSRIDDTFVLIK